MFRNSVDIFSSIFGFGRVSAFWGPRNWNRNHDDNYFSSRNTENFSFLSLIFSKKMSGKQDLQKNLKIADSSKPEVKSSKQKSNQAFLIIYRSLKFHANRYKRFREISCTKTVRKFIKITRRDLVAIRNE